MAKGKISLASSLGVFGDVRKCEIEDEKLHITIIPGPTVGAVFGTQFFTIVRDARPEFVNVEDVNTDNNTYKIILTK